MFTYNTRRQRYTESRLHPSSSGAPTTCVYKDYVNQVNHQLVSRYLIGLGLLALAGAIGYFSYTIYFTVKTLPQNLHYLKGVSGDLAGVAQEIRGVTEQVPVIVERVDQLQLLIPEVLAEVEAVRLAVPPILEQVEQTREVIPPVMSQLDRQIPEVLTEVAQVRTEVHAWRGEIPGFKQEGQAYRLTAAMALAESEQLREDIPTMLSRVEDIVDDVQEAGQKASEGAITGVITGVFKAPFSLINSATGHVLSGIEADTTDLQAVRKVMKKAVTGDIGKTYTWRNGKTERHGEVIALEEVVRDGRTCRRMLANAFEEETKVSEKEFWLCRDQNNQWQMIEN